MGKKSFPGDLNLTHVWADVRKPRGAVTEREWLSPRSGLIGNIALQRSSRSHRHHRGRPALPVCGASSMALGTASQSCPCPRGLVPTPREKPPRAPARACLPTPTAAPWAEFPAQLISRKLITGAPIPAPKTEAPGGTGTWPRSQEKRGWKSGRRCPDTGLARSQGSSVDHVPWSAASHCGFLASRWSPRPCVCLVYYHQLITQCPACCALGSPGFARWAQSGRSEVPGHPFPSFLHSCSQGDAFG